MFKKILKFLLYFFVVALISLGIVAGFYFLGRPLEEAFVVIGVIAFIWITYVIVKKLVIRARAKKQVQRVLQHENADDESDLGMSEKSLLKKLKNNWKISVKALKSSQLRLHGDPLYVLPWFMVFGKPSSGKSTSLRTARLLSPKIDFPDHEDGSTLNLEWWLYEEAIVIDTAGRYAVPDREKRDRKEWRTFLKILAKHKQKEPISGLVVVVAADRLLNDSEEMLLEEGRQVRASLSDLMGELEAKPPIYLMITKCDLIPGFTEWCEYIPEQSLRQPMGYLNEQQGGSLDEVIDTSLDVILSRMKELRLLMLERSHNTNDSLLTLPNEIEKIRDGVHLFANTAFKENVYQETPRFRGLYLSSSKYSENQQTEEGFDSTGAFLHHFYTRILPTDRGLTDNLAAAIRLRNTVRKYAVSIAGAVTALMLFALSSIYANDIGQLERVKSTYGEIKLNNGVINSDIASLTRLRDLILSLEKAQDEWVVPWTGTFDRPVHIKHLIDTYNDKFKRQVLDRIDSPLKRTIATADSRETSVVAGGVVRRINMIKEKLNSDTDMPLTEYPEITPDYIVLLDRSISNEAATTFNDLYTSYLDWNNSKISLNEERTLLNAALVALLERNQGDYTWIIDWADTLSGEPIRLSDFWGGNDVYDQDLPVIPPAYTLQGREAINTFMEELMKANDESGSLEKIKEDFDEFYERKYVRTWLNFAKRFDEGQKSLSGKKDWLTAVERMATDGNPYFTLIERLHAELEPIAYNDEFLSKTLVDYFVELKNYESDESGGGGGKGSKYALRLMSKAGKAGKVVSKVGKKALKVKKKMKGKSKEDLESVIEKASKAYGEYKDALTAVAFSADSRQESLNTISTLFASDGNSGDASGSVATAEHAVTQLQMLAGKPGPESKLFWELYTGPIRVAYEYMREEAACYLQEKWDTTVLSELEGLSKNKVGSALIAEGGLVWKFIDENASAFLHKKHLRGYSPVRVDGRGIPWTPEFMDFTNNGSRGRNIVSGEYTVSLRALPTGVNQEAKLSPYSAILELRCADGAQTLANYNYNSKKDFVWSLEKCGDVTLSVSIGQLTLRKEYKGQKAFPEFLSDFRDGHRVFVAKEFPKVRSQLRNLDVEAIDVNYEITGQEPVIEMLSSVPLDAPTQITTCWQ